MFRVLNVFVFQRVISNKSTKGQLKKICAQHIPVYFSWNIKDNA